MKVPVEPDKLPPNDLEAERAVLASLLLENAKIGQVQGILKARRPFYSSAHAAIWESITRLHGQRQPVDSITLGDDLRSRNRLDDVGGDAYIASLFKSVPTWINVEHYARIVNSKAIYRHLIEAAGRIGTIGYNTPDDEVTALAEARQLLDAVTRSTPTKTQVIRDVVARRLDRLDTLTFDPVTGYPTQPLKGVSWGMPTFDRVVGRMLPGQHILLAARPSVGKSGLALFAAVEAAKADIPVLIVNLEMDEDSLLSRMMAMGTGIFVDRIEEDRVNAGERENLISSCIEYGPLDIHFICDSGLTVNQLRGEVLSAVQDYRIGLVVIDYVQLINPREGGRDSEYEHLTLVSKTCARLAHELKDYDCACLSLSQFNRGAAGGGPSLEGLRGSGAFEQDADRVIALERPHQFAKKGTRDYDERGKMEVSQLKYRNGRTAFCNIQYDLARQTFTGPVLKEQEAQAPAPAGEWTETGERVA